MSRHEGGDDLVNELMSSLERTIAREEAEVLRVSHDLAEQERTRIRAAIAEDPKDRRRTRKFLSRLRRNFVPRKKR